LDSEPLENFASCIERVLEQSRIMCCDSRVGLMDIELYTIVFLRATAVPAGTAESAY